MGSIRRFSSALSFLRLSYFSILREVFVIWRSFSVNNQHSHYLYRTQREKSSPWKKGLSHRPAHKETLNFHYTIKSARKRAFRAPHNPTAMSVCRQFERVYHFVHAMSTIAKKNTEEKQKSLLCLFLASSMSLRARKAKEWVIRAMKEKKCH